MTIISKSHALRLIREGKAKDEGRCYQADKDVTYCVVSRSDQQRTDHYLVGAGDLRRDTTDDAA